MRFPTPYTLSVIEGYVEGNGGGAIVLNSEGTTEIGDTVEYLGEDYTIMSMTGFDDEAKIIKSSDVKEIVIEDFIEETVDNEMSESRIEVGDEFNYRVDLDSSNVQFVLDRLLLACFEPINY